MENNNEEGQVIYDVGVKIAWKKKKGNGYVNMSLGTAERPYQFVTRAKSIEHMNRSPEFMAKMMAFNGLTGKSIYDFHIKEEFYRKEISKSFAHKESEYNREFGE